MEITGQSAIPPDGQVVFSGNSPYSISAHTHLTQQQFSEFLQRAGGTRGHAILHLLPIPQLRSEKLQPDYSSLAKLTYAVDDPQNCVSLIVEHKFTDEIVHTMSYLQVQQKRQLEGMEEFWSVGVAQFSTGVDVWVCLQQFSYATNVSVLSCKHSQLMDLILHV